jgi:ATP-dependent DNA helicase RecQ
VRRPDLPVLATTATANTRVSDDVAEQLGSQTLVLRGPLARASLHLSVLPRLGEVEAFAWVDEHLERLPGSGIVYAATVKTATGLAEYLGVRGHRVRAYHGQMLTDERQAVEEELRANEVKAVIATSALGMGYDKPDLGFVVHVGSPGSPVDYYQQVGRAGRALDTAQVVLIPTPADEDIWRYFATASIPKEDDANAVLAELAAAPGSLSVPSLETATGIRRGRLELLVKVLAVEGAVERTVEGWQSTGRPWAYDRERYAALLAAREHEASLMRAYARSLRCLEGVLREALDDPASGDCGRCSACRGALPEGLGAAPADESIRAALAFLRGADVVLEPRRQWAPGLAWTGRIASGLAMQPGRALAYANDPAWPEAVRLAGGPDAEVDAGVVEGLTEVLARWRSQWIERPTVIVPVPSSRHPRLVGSLAERIGQVGRLPIIDALTVDGPPGDADQSARVRAQAQARRVALIPGASLAGETVLLVDDTWRSGWTATIAAALLRGAGAQHVLPMVIQQRP